MLVVDDNVDITDVLQDYLSWKGFEVYVARDGAAALEAAEVVRPEVVLLDIGLPELDGYQLAREARSAAVRTREGHRPWLVALTGYGQPEDRERALAAGFDRHLTKPVSVASLRQAVEEASQTPSARVPAQAVRVARNPSETTASKLGAH